MNESSVFCEVSTVTSFLTVWWKLGYMYNCTCYVCVSSLFYNRNNNNYSNIISASFTVWGVGCCSCNICFFQRMTQMHHMLPDRHTKYRSISFYTRSNNYSNIILASFTVWGVGCCSCNICFFKRMTQMHHMLPDRHTKYHSISFYNHNNIRTNSTGNNSSNSNGTLPGARTPQLIPPAFSTAGALGPMRMEFCAALRQRARDRVRPVSIFRMLLPASVALQRGNGRLIASYFARCGVVE